MSCPRCAPPQASSVVATTSAEALRTVNLDSASSPALIVQRSVPEEVPADFDAIRHSDTQVEIAAFEAAPAAPATGVIVAPARILLDAVGGTDVHVLLHTAAAAAAVAGLTLIGADLEPLHALHQTAGAVDADISRQVAVSEDGVVATACNLVANAADEVSHFHARDIDSALGKLLGRVLVHVYEMVIL